MKKIRKKRKAHGEKQRKKRKGSSGDDAPDAPSFPATATVACPVCRGAGTLLGKLKEARHANAPGVVTKLRERPLGWQARGVLPVGNPHRHERLKPGVGEALTGLCGDWRIFQKVGGHRWSTEDIVTAWYAAKILKGGKAPLKVVDLGCGIGSVLLQCAWLWPQATAVGIEAQPTSAGLARRSIEYNLGHVDRRVKLIEGDIRNEATLTSAREILVASADCASVTSDISYSRSGSGEERSKRRKVLMIPDNDTDRDITLVTGTPPYFHIERDEAGNAIPIQGGMPSCVNSAPARNEFRGGIEVYCDAAAKILRGNTGSASSGTFVVTMAYQVARVEAAAARSGLVIFRRLDVIGKTGKSPLFASFAMRLAINDESVVAAGGANDAAGARAKTHVESLTVRGSDLKHTAEYEALMQRMGIPPVRKK